MKNKIRKLISQYKAEIRELHKNPNECTRENNPVVYGCIHQLQTVILDLEELL